MKYYEYGKQNSDVVILLHGGGLSWWNYKDIAVQLEEKFHVIIPILDGHSESDKAFTSIEDNADEIMQFIDDNFDGHVLFMGGLSLGAQILVNILAKRNDICDYTIIESCLAKPQKMIYKLIGPSVSMSYGLINKKWFARLQFKSLKIREDLFEDYYRDSSRISKQDMIQFLKANADFSVKASLNQLKATTLIVVGEKEQKVMKQSAKLLNEIIHNSHLQILKGYVHGELSLNHPDEYVKLFYDLISSNSKMEM